MGKKKKNKKIRQQKLPLPLKKQQEKQSSAGKRILHGAWKSWKIIYVVMGIILTIIGYDWFRPELSIHPLTSLDLADPFFELSNDSKYSIHDVRVTTSLTNIHFSGTIQKNKMLNQEQRPRKLHFENLTGHFGGGKAHISGGQYDWNKVIPTIKRGEKTTIPIPLSSVTSMTVKTAEIDILVSFKPSVFPFKSKKTFRYTTNKNSKGQLLWTTRSVSE